jgi:hypothetical protein
VAGRGLAQSGPGARWTNHLQTPQVKTSIHDFAVFLTASPGRIGLIARAAFVLVLFEHKMIT